VDTNTDIEQTEHDPVGVFLPKLTTMFDGTRAVDAVFRAGSRQAALAKARSMAKQGLSRGTTLQAGEVLPSLDYENAKRLRDCATYHSRCIQILAKNTVGLGHRKRRVREVLQPLVHDETTWTQLCIQVAMDYFEFGQGYMEVVRDEFGIISGVHYRSAETVTVHVDPYEEDTTAEDYHYLVRTAFGSQLHVRRFVADTTVDVDPRPTDIEFEEGVELICFRQDEEDTVAPWYAVPHWVSAINKLELAGIATEFFYDFFYNRAVPSLAIFLVGDEADPKSIETVRKEFSSMGGPGQNYRTAIVAVPGSNVELVVEKLSAHEGQHEVLERISAVTAQEILSIHGVPAAIAGIQIPGKMSAANEFVNALMAFQLLQVGPAQVYFSERLACTLGEDSSIEVSSKEFSPNADGEEGTLPDGNGFISMLDAVNVLMLDAASRMNDPAMSPNRDVSQGLARNGRDGNASRLGSASRGT
jgi:hypothetical protein